MESIYQPFVRAMQRGTAKTKAEMDETNYF
jgi:hypothetical protein